MAASLAFFASSSNGLKVETDQYHVCSLSSGVNLLNLDPFDATGGKYQQLQPWASQKLTLPPALILGHRLPLG